MVIERHSISFTMDSSNPSRSVTWDCDNDGDSNSDYSSSDHNDINDVSDSDDNQ